MSKNKSVPKRRFKEFQDTDAWEQRKLSELGKVTTGKAFSSTDFNEDGEYLVITNKDISDSTRSQNTVTDRIDTSNDKLISQYKLSGENILVTMDGVNLGKTGMYSNDKALLAQRVGRIQSDQIEFVYQLTSNPLFLSTMRTLSVGNAIKHISLKQIADYTSFVPTNKEEQAKIGSFCANLDDTITLHQHKLEKTKALKSAYLAEMFPIQGERVPKRRFTGFKKDWQETILGELGNTFSGMSGKTKKDFGHGDAEFVTYMNVFKNEVSDTLLTEKVVLDNRQTEVKYGDVLFTTSSETPHEVGMSSMWLDNRPNVYLNSFCFGFRPASEINKLYLAYLLRSNEVRKQIEILAQGISRYNISKGKVMEITIYIPDYKEQKEIGEFFKKLDNTISNQQQKLNKLKAMKQAYLEEVFV